MTVGPVDFRPMDAGIAAIGGALVGAVAALGTAALTTWVQRETARTTVRAEYQKEVRQPRRDAYRKLISAGIELAESAAGEWIWIEQEHVTPALNLKDPIDESWLEISLLGPVNTAAAATEVRRQAYVVFGHLWSLRSFWNSSPAAPDVEEERVTQLGSEIDSAAVALRDAVLALSRSAQISLEDTGLT